MIWNDKTRVIAHIDADAFFASCEQALRPQYKNKPIVIGRERGIAVAVSYEAKAKGVVRGMTIQQIKRVSPETVVVPSDHETYSLFSKRMFSIIKRYTESVEEYGIDEAFIDLTDMRKPMGVSHSRMAYNIKKEIEKKLGITVSIGIAPTKVLAKAASNWNKPDGFCHITQSRKYDYLKKLSIENIWGVGKNTAAYMHQLGIFTAYQFANKSVGFIEAHFTRPHQSIWRELNGDSIYAIKTEEKTHYATISKSRTFAATTQKDLIFSELVKNLENACIKARTYKLSAKKLVVMLKTQKFEIAAIDVCLSRASAYPSEIVTVARVLFDQLYKPGTLYRTTGITLGSLNEDNSIQATLFEEPIKLTKMKEIYATVDKLSTKFGRHTVHLGVSNAAHKLQKRNYVKSNKKFNIPMLA